MADLITRLKVDSTEYDAKIKRAAQGLQHYVQSAHDSGDVIGRLLGDTKKYVESLGNMATVSTTARGRLNELTAAFTDLRSVYNSLSEEEKNAKGGFGQELNKQLEILKGRINDTKNELKGIDQELGNTKQAEDGAKSGLEGLTSALGINVKSLAGWGAALAAGKVALDVAKDAFFANESTVDDWGRTVESAKGIYEGFLQSLNTGDISGFLNNISQITAAAREAYNALDELGTRQTILNPERAKLQARSTELKATIRREGANSAAGKAAAAELKALEKPLTEAWKTESKLNRDAFTALVKERLAEGGINLNQKSFNQFMKTFSSDAAFQSLRKNAKGSIGMEYTGGGSYDEGSVKKVDTRNVEQKLLDLFTDEWRKKNSGFLTAAYNAQGSAASTMLSDARYLNGGKGNKGTKKEYDDLQKVQQEIAKLTKEAYTADSKRVEEIQAEIAGLQEEERRLTSIRDLVTNKNNDPLKALESQFPDMSKQNYNTGYAGSAQAKADSAIADFAQGGVGNADISGFISSAKQAIDQSELGDDLYNKMTEKLKDATMFQSVLTQAIAGGASAADLSGVAQEIKQKLLEGDIDETAWQEFLDKINEYIQNADLKLVFDVDTKSVTTAVKQQKKETAEMAKNWQAAGSAIQAVGSAMQQIEDPAAKVLGTIAQAVATMALSYAQAAASPAVTGSGWGWIAFAATGVATMLSSIEAIKNATHFAQGGIVGGNDYTDNTQIMVSSGELILNRAQQGNLASQLEGGGIGNLHLDTVIRAEDIRLVLNNNGRRTGRGEYVTTRNSRT